MCQHDMYAIIKQNVPQGGLPIVFTGVTAWSERLPLLFNLTSCMEEDTLDHRFAKLPDILNET